MLKQICQVSGEEFEVSEQEIKLREKFSFTDLPTTVPWIRFRELGAFWQHWNLHNRKCDKTEKPIISVFSEKCPYPVWKREEWITNNNPPNADYNFSRDFFSQAWELFQKCPIPNNFQSHNENCEYTDDWYRSKNCYLCHSGQHNEDCQYCYGCDKDKDLHWGILSFKSELCIDLISCHNCFDSIYLLNCKQIQSSSFLYDCRNCANCMFCFNLRNKQYCFGNKQLSREEYEKKEAQWNLKSREIYDKAKEFFAEMMLNRAWHRTLQIDKSENSTGDILTYTKNCKNCYMLTYHEDCANVAFCGPGAKMILDSLGTVGTELSFSSSLPVYCYEVRFCFSVDKCRFVDYSAHCFQCKDCFGCCGLINKQYCIFNKQYSPDEYRKTREKIIKQMKKEGTWGNFFPGYFAPNPYDESWAGYHFPLSEKEQKDLGFCVLGNSERKNKDYFLINEIPDSVDDITNEEEFSVKIFWDEKYKKPFQITLRDIKFSRDLGCPLPNSYYMRRIKGNFAWMPFDGKLRDCECGKCSKKIQTSWDKKYNNRILCEECYLKVLN